MLLKYLIIILSLFYISSFTWAKTIPNEEKLKIEQAHSKIPLYFIQNNGQMNEHVKYYENSLWHRIYFTTEGVFFLLIEKEKIEDEISKADILRKERGLKKDKIITEVISIRPIGGKKVKDIIAEGELQSKINYFIGNDTKRWKIDIPTYSKIRYKEIYPGIDLLFYGTQRQLEYDIIVRPGGDLSKVAFELEGVKEVNLGNEGDLIIILPSGREMIQKSPIIYQEIEGKRVEIKGNYIVEKKDNKYIYAFRVEEYSKDYSLIIDPVILGYSTFLGGIGMDFGEAIVVDSIGNAYITGNIFSSDFPITIIDPPYNRGSLGWYYCDVFVSKFSPQGNLIYSTYFGGLNYDYGFDIAVDLEGNAYVTGVTMSDDFPIKNAFQTNRKGVSNAFITKINREGNDLIYSTYLGGNRFNGAYGIAVDSEGNAYVTGYTEADDFPVLNAYQGSRKGFRDAFITKLSPQGNSLIYSTYLGGANDLEYGDGAFGIAVDSEKNAYVTGWTSSRDFPIINAFQSINGGGLYDAFVTKLNSQGNSLVYSTYLGGSQGDIARRIAVDSEGNAYITGFTDSYDFHAINAFQNNKGGGRDAFVTKLNHQGNMLIYSTYLGGSNHDEGFDIAVDGLGNAYVTGWTSSNDFPTQNAYQNNYAGVYDVFVTKLSSNGKFLIYSTYLGGSKDDEGFGIALDPQGNAYVTGYTSSPDFPLINAYQTNYKYYDVFVCKLIFLGDIDNDGDIDQDDLSILLKYRNQPASACPACDLDGDGMITVLDARKLVLLCTRPKCATQ